VQLPIMQITKQCTAESTTPNISTVTLQQQFYGHYRTCVSQHDNSIRRLELEDFAAVKFYVAFTLLYFMTTGAFKLNRRQCCEFSSTVLPT